MCSEGIVGIVAALVNAGATVYSAENQPKPPVPPGPPPENPETAEEATPRQDVLERRRVAARLGTAQLRQPLAVNIPS